MPSFMFLTSPLSTNSSGVTTVLAGKRLRSWTLTSAYSFRKGFLKPRLASAAGEVSDPLRSRDLCRPRTWLLVLYGPVRPSCLGPSRCRGLPSFFVV